MRRSEINRIMRDGTAFCAEHRFRLPPFAAWTPGDWAAAGPDSAGIVEDQLGWDITDFGSGDYAGTGLFLFTIRNGSFARVRQGGKPYAEKLLIVGEGQVTPIHFHWSKTEDIINRGGGSLVCRLWNRTADEALADTTVEVACDGVLRRVPAGGELVLRPGESVTLPAGLYHTFWGEPGTGRVLVGEVSTVNDDRIDNRFLQPIGRFPAIVEDEAPQHLLTADYPRYCAHLQEAACR